MNWAGPDAFFAMGGYGTYVWGAFGVFACCLVAEAVAVSARLRRALRDAGRGNDLDDPEDPS